MLVPLGKSQFPNYGDKIIFLSIIVIIAISSEK